MVFSQPIFLFLFLPAVLLIYAPAGLGWKNAWLLTASLMFYAWGEELYLLLLLASIAVNYAAGRAIAVHEGAARRRWLLAGVAANLGLLGYFKYTEFLLSSLGVPGAAEIAPPLPIGISFFTFQALSYLVDLYYGRIAVQRDPLRLALYISMFPQLIAGPIVRYAEVETALIQRKTGHDDISEGVSRFVTGLAKKVLIADPLGLVADEIFAIPDGGLGPATAWLGTLTYSLQLYFDFSAYSDMAIGLGRLFGFRFPENFDYPYRSRSITEFWRRWHMTLSRWFRDYLYIPLGGNRGGAGRTYLNLSIVFLATGLWHGAAWTFVLWGAFHGAFLVLERVGLGRRLASAPEVLGHLYLVVVVAVGWVLFRAESLAQAGDFYAAMFLGRTGPLADLYPLARFADPYIAGLIALASVLSVGAGPALAARVREGASASAARTLATAGFWALFAASIVTAGAASYSPFLYFRF